MDIVGRLSGPFCSASFIGFPTTCRVSVHPLGTCSPVPVGMRSFGNDCSSSHSYILVHRVSVVGFKSNQMEPLKGAQDPTHGFTAIPQRLLSHTPSPEVRTPIHPQSRGFYYEICMPEVLKPNVPKPPETRFLLGNAGELLEAFEAGLMIGA